MMPLTQTQGYRAALYQAQAVLTPQAFRDWLLERYYQPVGRAFCEGECPLANFLSARLTVPFEVDKRCYRLADTRLSAPLPAWAQTFVEIVDRMYGFVAVTGAQALVAFDVVAQVMQLPV
jgi:hypothetical protein